MSLLKSIVESYMRKVSGLKEHCNRCLRTERWGGSHTQGLFRPVQDSGRGQHSPSGPGEEDRAVH